VWRSSGSGGARHGGDLVPLDANNRILVAQGLKRIRTALRARTRALLQLAKRGIADCRDRSGRLRGAATQCAARIDDMTIGYSMACWRTIRRGRIGAGPRGSINSTRRRRALERRCRRKRWRPYAAARSGSHAVQRSGVCLFDEFLASGCGRLVAAA